MGKQINIGDVFTDDEISRAIALWMADPGKFHERATAEIVQPALPRINATTGQENDAGYFAYALELALTVIGPQKESGVTANG